MNVKNKVAEVAKKMLLAVIPKSYKPISAFPYPLVYESARIDTGTVDGFPYAESDNVRVFFPSTYSCEEAEAEYRGYRESEGLTGFGCRTKSPHCYITKLHRPKASDILVDFGAAEGYFARTFAKEVKKIYLIESDKKWNAPLRKTFNDCFDKVSLIFKYAGNPNINHANDGIINNDVVSLDTIFAGITFDKKQTFFIKMDIEGYEESLLLASKNFLLNNQCRLSVCTYHRPSDYRKIRKILKSFGYSVSHSNGWMIPRLPPKGYVFPYWRRGIIYASNESEILTK